MKKYKITYHMMPDVENIVIHILADSYEEACIYAKNCRRNAFSIEEE